MRSAPVLLLYIPCVYTFSDSDSNEIEQEREIIDTEVLNSLFIKATDILKSKGIKVNDPWDIVEGFAASLQVLTQSAFLAWRFQFGRECFSSQAHTKTHIK